MIFTTNSLHYLYSIADMLFFSFFFCLNVLLSLSKPILQVVSNDDANDYYMFKKQKGHVDSMGWANFLHA